MQLSRWLNVLLAVTLGLAASGSSARAETPVANRILLVVQLKAAPATVAADAAVKQHLESLGYTITERDESQPVPPVAGEDLIVISSSTSAHKLEAKYRLVTLPVVTWESYLLPQMGMSGMRENGDFGTIEKNRYLWMVNAPHPLSAGLPSGLLNVYKRGAPMNWGKPGLGATIVATLPGEPGRVAEFAYEKGATMDYENIAPARRVFIFLDNTTFTGLNDAGTKLFDAAISWSLSGAPACDHGHPSKIQR